MRNLAGRNAVVTGAASGIGLGISRALAGAGVNLVLADIEQEPLDRAAMEIASRGVTALGIRLDVSDAADVERVAKDVAARLAPLHILVNNAGVTFAGQRLLDVPQQQWDWIFGVNVFGTLNCLRSFLPLIRAHGEGGHVVNTASIGGLQVNPVLRNGPYAMSKYAVVALSETLALDLEGSGIGISVFCPALVATDLLRSSARRPARFGGPYRPELPRQPPAMPTRAISADEAGQRVLRAIEDDEFFVFTHPETRAWLEERHGRLIRGFDRTDAYCATQAGRAR